MPWPTWPWPRRRLARRDGDPEEARRQLDLVTINLGSAAELENMRAWTEDLLGYLAEDPAESRSHRVAAWQAASATGAPMLIAQVLIGIAELALRRDQYEQAGRLLAASIGLRGVPDRSHPELVRIERDVRRHLGEARFAEVTEEGTRANWSELAEVTLAS